MYNAHNFWQYTLPTIADIPRARDDYGKYFVAHSFIHVPVAGVHGSFLLISGLVQNAVGWDTASAAEDMWFGLEVCVTVPVDLLLDKSNLLYRLEN
jgi:hypothetical protein